MVIGRKVGVEKNTGARKLNNQQSPSSALSLVWFPSVVADADSGSPNPATLALTQSWAGENPPTPLHPRPGGR